MKKTARHFFAIIAEFMGIILLLIVNRNFQFSPNDFVFLVLFSMACLFLYYGVKVSWGIVDIGSSDLIGIILSIALMLISLMCLFDPRYN